MAIEPSDKVKDLTLGDKPGQAPSFVLTPDSLYINRPNEAKWSTIVAPLRQIVWAEVVDSVLKLSVLVKKKKDSASVLVNITGDVPAEKKEAAAEFVQAVMDVAYNGAKTHRHLLVLVNPKSGPGKSVQRYTRQIEPVFKAAHCTADVIHTAYHKHAWEVAKELPLDKYDAVVCVSGDGLVFEVLNGFREHKNPMRAFRIPIAPIPTGSGNALSLNLMGLKDGFDACIATLNAVKGQPMAADLLSVTQGDKRIISFMSQAIGLMSELDLGTEHLRFMGDSRFMYGYIRGVIQHRSCPVKVSIKVASSDKQKMVDDLMSAREQAARNTADATNSSSVDTTEDSYLPTLLHQGSPTGDGWITFEKPICFLMAGKGPLVARDLMLFPVSLPADGYVDVTIQETTPRKDMLKLIDGAEKGKPYWSPKQHYYKAEAYRVETHAPHSYLSVDGEWYPFEPFQVEVHKGLGTWLSMYGTYNVCFEAPPPKK